MADNIKKTLTIENRRGLHARASAKFVKCAEQFDARIFVERNGERVLATSIMGLMMLSASAGASITLEAEGKDAVRALAALTQLVADGFGEE